MGFIGICSISYVRLNGTILQIILHEFFHAALFLLARTSYDRMVLFIAMKWTE